MSAVPTTLDRGNVRSCYRCAAPGSVVEVSRDGCVVATGALCDPCFAHALEEADRLRSEFEALLSTGMARETANARMIEKIEGRNGRA